MGLLERTAICATGCAFMHLVFAFIQLFSLKGHVLKWLKHYFLSLSLYFILTTTLSSMQQQNHILQLQYVQTELGSSNLVAVDKCPFFSIFSCQKQNCQNGTMIINHGKGCR